jgi:hypothetical protein
MQQALGIDDRNQPIVEVFRAYLAKHPDEKTRLAAMGGEIAYFASSEAKVVPADDENPMALEPQLSKPPASDGASR